MKSAVQLDLHIRGDDERVAMLNCEAEIYGIVRATF